MKARSAALLALPLLACGAQAGDPQEPHSSKTGVTPISLEWLLRTYAENPSRADGMYRGRVFEFSAVVGGSESDAAGRRTLLLKAAEEPGVASCKAAAQSNDLPAAPKDSTLRLRGRVIGLNSRTSTIVLGECQVVP